MKTKRKVLCFGEDTSKMFSVEIKISGEKEKK